MQERDTGPHRQCGLGEAGGELAEVLEAERAGDLGVVSREADLLPGLAAGDIEGRLLKSISLASGECGLSCSLGQV